MKEKFQDLFYFYGSKIKTVGIIVVAFVLIAVIFWGVFFLAGKFRINELGEIETYQYHSNVPAGEFMRVNTEELKTKFIKHCQNAEPVLISLKVGNGMNEFDEQIQTASISDLVSPDLEKEERRRNARKYWDEEVLPQIGAYHNALKETPTRVFVMIKDITEKSGGFTLTEYWDEDDIAWMKRENTHSVFYFFTWGFNTQPGMKTWELPAGMSSSKKESRLAKQAIILTNFLMPASGEQKGSNLIVQWFATLGKIKQYSQVEIVGYSDWMVHDNDKSKLSAYRPDSQLYKDFIDGTSHQGLHDQAKRECGIEVPSYLNGHVKFYITSPDAFGKKRDRTQWQQEMKKFVSEFSPDGLSFDWID